MERKTAPRRAKSPKSLKLASENRRLRRQLKQATKDLQVLRLAQKAQARTESFLDAVFRANPTSIALFRFADGQILSANPAFLDMIGYPRDQVIGHSFLDLDVWTDPKDRARLQTMLRAEPKISGQQVNFKTRTGDTRQARVSVEPIHTDSQLCLVLLAEDITERERAEQALRTSEKNLAALFQSIPISASVYRHVGDELVLIDYNQAALDLTRGDVTAFIGKPAREVIQPIPNLFEEMERCLRERTTIHLTTPYLFKATGDTRVLKIALACAPPDMVVTLTQDITESVRAEEDLRLLNEELEQRVAERTAELSLANQSLREEVAERIRVDKVLNISMDRYRRLVELLPSGMLVHRRGIIELINGAGMEIFGATDVSQLVGKPIMNFVHPDYRSLVQERERWLETTGGRAPLIEEKLLRVDGSVFEAEASVAQFSAPEGPAVQVVFHDITARKRIERERDALIEQLEVERNRWQTTVESMLNPVTIADAEGQTVYMNSAFAQLARGNSQADQDDSTSTWAPDLYRPDGTPFPAPQLPLERAACEGKPIRNVEIVHGMPGRSGGKERIILWNAAPLRDVSKRIVGSVAVGYDITERRAAEVKVEQLNRVLEQRATQLESANRDLELFAYSVSHDLRTPLASVDGFARVLLEDYAQDLPLKAQRYLGFIRTGTTQMSDLIDGILAISRLTTQPIRRQHVSMREMVCQALEPLEHEVNRRGVEVEIGTLPEVYGDPVLLKQIWANLLSNAIKFTRTRSPGHIQVGSRVEDAETVFYVKDNGVGFDVECTDKLFGIFQRFHHEDEYEGYGIGLATVARIIRMHNGRVWAEAAVEQGAEFCFVLGD